LRISFLVGKTAIIDEQVVSLPFAEEQKTTEIISVVLPAPSFAQDTAQKLGITDRTIRYKTQIGTATNSTPSEVIGIDDDPQPMYPTNLFLDGVKSAADVSNLLFTNEYIY